jgi:hypothetical protein
MKEARMARGVLLAAMDFSNAHEDEFHDWYDLEHLPERQRVPGFGLCERWIGAANPKFSVATYDLDTPSVLRSQAYRHRVRESFALVEARDRDGDRAAAHRGRTDPARQ